MQYSIAYSETFANRLTTNFYILVVKSKPEFRCTTF